MGANAGLGHSCLDGIQAQTAQGRADKLGFVRMKAVRVKGHHRESGEKLEALQTVIWSEICA